MNKKGVKYKGVNGFLLLFIFILALNVFLDLYYGVNVIKLFLDSEFILTTAKIWLIPLLAILYLGHAIFVGYSTHALYNFKKNAISLTKWSLFLIFITGVIVTIPFFFSLNDGISIVFGILFFTSFNIGNGFFCIFWNGYLNSSKRVKNTYPISKRKKISKKWKILFYSIIAIPILIFILATALPVTVTLDNQSVESCSEFDNFDLRNSCFLTQGLEELNSTYCEQIEIEHYKYQCLGIVNEDVDFCAEINQEKGTTSESAAHECFKEVAKKKNNEGMCYGIENENFINDCVAVFEQDEEVCLVAGSYKDVCYKNVAVEKLNETVCENIISYSNSILLNDCYASVALAKEDKSICANINVPRDVARCNKAIN
tara:strand:+ start:214 stop:1329 length:1116 start_codon:yes stop_codon:yes gene_type:complete